MKEGDYGECEDCKADHAEAMPCPFASEIHADDTLVFLCGNCAHARYMET